MDLPKIRDAAVMIETAWRAARSAKLASDELELSFPDETARRRDLGRSLVDQASKAARLLGDARSKLKQAIDELEAKRAEGERATQEEDEPRAVVGDTPKGVSKEWLNVGALNSLKGATHDLNLGNTAWSENRTGDALVHWEAAGEEVAHIEAEYKIERQRVPAEIARSIRAIKDGINKGGAQAAATPPGEQLQWMLERKGVESAESGTPGKLYVLTTGPGPRYEVVAKYGSDELDRDGRAKFGRGHRFKNSHLARRAAEKHYHWLTAGPPLNPYQDQRAAVEAPRMTGPRALIEPRAVEDHARKLAQAERGLRVVPDVDAELAEIDRELDELETAPRAQVVTQWRDRKPERKTGRQWTR